MIDDLEDPPGFGPAHKRVAELSNAELTAELERRRSLQPQAAARLPPPTTLSARQVAQYLANLELSAGAGSAEIAAAYERLVAKYEPGQSAQDEEQRGAATRLLASLTDARDALLAHLARR